MGKPTAAGKVKNDRVLAETIKVAIQQRDAQRAAGASRQELDRNLEQTVRAAWPQTREWKYLCRNCSDYGLVMFQCLGDSTCGRQWAHGPHDFGRPCECSAGRRFVKPMSKTEDATDAGRRKPTRFGR